MSDIKRFTRKEIHSRNSKTDAVFIIENKVYEVTKFLDDHPGGHEVLLGVAGKDASEDFNDIGHSADARELMQKYLIGEIVDEEKVQVRKRKISWDGNTKTQAESSSFLSSWQFPIVLGLIVTVLYTYLFG